jgi:uncharacterized protein (DUF1800 family)
MRQIAATTLALLTQLTPLPLWAGPESMTYEEARHLVSRTGFGAAPDEISAMVGKSYTDGVTEILAAVQTTPQHPMPAWVDGWAYPTDQIWALGNTASDLFFTNRWMDIATMQKWWLREMIETPSPLTEKLVLFWHDHFAANAGRHEDPQWAARQNRLFRTHAAANFADLATGILEDPGMLVFLTNTENDRVAPNENLAREFMELFTLGEGRGYTEDDVVQAARALTGHTVDRFGARNYIFDPEAHDHGIKTILGNTGRHNADDLPRIVMNDPAFGPFIVERLWQAFVSNTPDPDEVARLTDIWRAADWEMKPLLRAMFLSDAFWSAKNRGTLVKSPVDLMVGSVRTLGRAVPYLDDLNWALGDLGQELFFPPNVGGWPEGINWINDATASARATMLTYMLGYDPVPRDAGSMMMMQPQSASAPTTLAPEDLAIGQVFIIEASKWGEGSGNLAVTLFDVSFGSYRWRSITFGAEIYAADEMEFSLHVSDCVPECFARWHRQTQAPFGWLWFHSRQIQQNDTDWMTDADRVLLAALMGHFPDIIASTTGQRAWTEGSGLSLQEAENTSQRVADFAGETLGPPQGQLLLAATPPVALGLGGINVSGMSEKEAERYVEEREAALNISATPRYEYQSAEAWLHAVKAGGFDSLRAQSALLALPLPTEGQRMERVASDPEALIRHIVLSPYYQLN